MPKLSKFRMNNMLIDITVPDGEITTEKIADNAVTNHKISNNAVTASKIANGAVSSSKLANGAISELAIADGSITANKIADGAVVTNKIADGSVTTSKLQNGCVTTSKIDDDAVTYTELAPNAVETPIIKNSAVTNDKIANGTISENKLDSAVQAKLNATSGDPLEPVIIDITGADHDKVTNNEIATAISLNQQIYFYEQNEEYYINLNEYEETSQGYVLGFTFFALNTTQHTLLIEDFLVTANSKSTPDGYPTMSYKSATLTTNS